MFIHFPSISTRKFYVYIHMILCINTNSDHKLIPFVSKDFGKQKALMINMLPKVVSACVSLHLRLFCSVEIYVSPYFLQIWALKSRVVLITECGLWNCTAVCVCAFVV